MKRNTVMMAAAIMAAGALLLLAQATVQRVGNAAVAAQSIGRLVVDPGGTAELIAYLPVISGLPSSALFSGEPSEKTAHFTVRSTRFRIASFQNGGLAHFGVIPLDAESVRIRVYYDPYPNQDFDKPETFGDGTAAGAYIWHSGLGSSTDTMANFSGGLELESSTAITFLGRAFDLSAIAPSTTIFINGPTLRADRDRTVSIPWGGTVLASPAR